MPAAASQSARVSGMRSPPSSGPQDHEVAGLRRLGHLRRLHGEQVHVGHDHAAFNDPDHVPPRVRADRRRRPAPVARARSPARAVLAGAQTHLCGPAGPGHRRGSTHIHSAPRAVGVGARERARAIALRRADRHDDRPAPRRGAPGRLGSCAAPPRGAARRDPRQRRPDRYRGERTPRARRRERSAARGARCLAPAPPPCRPARSPRPARSSGPLRRPPPAAPCGAARGRARRESRHLGADGLLARRRRRGTARSGWPRRAARSEKIRQSGCAKPCTAPARSCSTAAHLLHPALDVGQRAVGLGERGRRQERVDRQRAAGRGPGRSRSHSRARAANGASPTR